MIHHCPHLDTICDHCEDRAETRAAERAGEFMGDVERGELSDERADAAERDVDRWAS